MVHVDEHFPLAGRQVPIVHNGLDHVALLGFLRVEDPSLGVERLGREP